MRSSIIGAIAGYLSLWSVYHLFRLLTGKEGMGYGDFKLFAALGAWLGWKMLLADHSDRRGRRRRRGHRACWPPRGRAARRPSPSARFWPPRAGSMLMFGQELVTGYLGLFARR